MPGPHHQILFHLSGVGTCTLMFLKPLGALSAARLGTSESDPENSVYTTLSHFSKRWSHHIKTPKDSDSKGHCTLLSFAMRSTFEDAKEVNRSI